MVTQSNRKMTIWLFIIFLTPMILAGVFFYRGKPIGNGTNRGMLINPPVAASKLFDSLPAKWTLLWFNPNQCQQRDCLDLVHQLYQIKKAMGKHQNDVEVGVLTLQANGNDPVLEKIFSANKQIINSKVSQEKYLRVMSSRKIAGTIYLIDPRGYIMMRYSQNVDPMDIFKDLNKLLRFSG